MMAFFIIAVVLVAIALALVLPPLFRTRAGAAPDRDRQNIEIARERYAELKADAAKGIITPEQFEEARVELETALFNDLQHDPEARGGARGRWAAVAVTLAVPVLSAGLYLLLGNPLAIGLPERHAADATAANQLAAIDAMVDGLAARLRQNPDDLQGWIMLGRSYKVLKRFPEAVEALKHAHEMAPGQPDIMLQYADAMAMASGGRVAGKPAELVKAALALKPDDVTGLWLAGIAEAEQGRVDLAVAYWRRAVPLLADDPAAQAELRALIAEGERRLGAPSEAPAGTAQGPAREVQVNVAMAPNLAGRAAATDTLFVYAQALSGPPMPLAIVRKQAKDLPLDVSLSDALAMAPSAKLSAHDQVRITARISKTGNAMPESGDLLGSAAPVTVGSGEPVRIVIDGIVP